ncbi:hypothetical protein [Roseibium sp.]|uniref:hypothetical protein n=1 Tax=Roseibium sp. TaxID=1936156 RepID=UPI003A980C85
MFRIFLFFFVGTFTLSTLAQAKSDLPRLGIGTLSTSKYAIKGNLSVWSSCETKDDYIKLHKAVVKRTEAHERAFSEYFEDRLDKGLSKKKRSEEFRKLYRRLKSSNRELSKINGKSKFGAPLAVKCTPFPKTSMLIETNAAFGNHICVRPVKGGKCGWTDKRAFKGYYRLGKDTKTWVPGR